MCVQEPDVLKLEQKLNAGQIEEVILQVSLIMAVVIIIAIMMIIIAVIVIMIMKL